MQPTLSPEERDILLKLAREALEAAARGRRLPPLDLSALPERLRRPGASFVTLTEKGMLRGCIGALEAHMPLAEDVRQHAAAAALYDYRFFPVQPDELQHIRVEVSVLSEPRPLNYEKPEELPGLLRAGIDGVILVRGDRRATFLPQVWQKVPEPERFLAQLCEKAGLSPEAWRGGDVQVYTYQVEHFQEPEEDAQAAAAT